MYFTTGVSLNVNGLRYNAVVIGDVNSDGTANSTDFMRIRASYLGKNEVKGYNALAADVNGDERINSTDFMKIRRHFLGLNLISQGDAMVLSEHPAKEYKDFKIEHDNREVVFGEYGAEYEQKFSTYIKPYKERVKEEYTGIDYIYTAINSLDVEKYEYLYVDLQDDDLIFVSVTKHNEYIQRYIELLQKLELKEISQEESDEINEKYIHDGFMSAEAIWTSFFGNDAVHFDFGFVVLGRQPNPFDREITCGFAGKRFAITNLDEVKYDIYELLASILNS